jgi:hypothetical protein
MTINSSNSLASNATDDALSIKVASMAKNQQKAEGQMAVQLIQSATVEQVALPSTATSGANINIKV